MPLRLYLSRITTEASIEAVGGGGELSDRDLEAVAGGGEDEIECKTTNPIRIPGIADYC